MKKEWQSLGNLIYSLWGIDLCLIYIALFLCWRIQSVESELMQYLEWGIKIGRLGSGIFFLGGAIVFVKFSFAAKRKYAFLSLSVLLFCFQLLLIFWDPFASLTELAGFPHHSVLLRGWIVYSPMRLYQKIMLLILYSEILFMWWLYAKALLGNHGKLKEATLET